MKVIEGGAFCAACFNFVSDSRAVEFSASFDGPVIETGSVDELMLCEQCIRNAMDVLDVDPQAMTNAINAVEAAEKKADQWRTYAEKLEGQMAGRPEPLKRTGKAKQPA